MKFLFSLLYAFAASVEAAETNASPLGKAVPAINWAQWLGAVASVVLALLLFAWLLRRFQTLPGARHAELRVLGGIALGAREKVVLLQTGRKQLVLGVTPGRIDTLCVLEGEDRIQPEPAAPGETPFATLLRQWTQGRNAS